SGTEKPKELIETVKVAGGSFMYGKDGGNPGGMLKMVGTFRMGKYPVTQEQWEKVMEDNPSSFNSNPAEGEVQEKRPVEYVNWYDVLVFANKLSVMEGLSPVYEIKGSTDPEDWGTVPSFYNEDWDAVKVRKAANGWRLPTELEWEYAAKGGMVSSGYGSSYDYHPYAGSDDVDEVAWYVDNSDRMTHEVGKKRPNELGLYDMSGNVYEWCYDLSNPNFPNAARVSRGGCWGDVAAYVRLSFRNGGDPFIQRDFTGFRLVRP
ncbi:MAG: formylglycine-generating enzyme family protein, partial [Treponema sp.]|nr:formylglycine-generating enzyme family protein [Treponema sp.]